VVDQWFKIGIIGWVMKTLETQVGQFLRCCKCPVGRGIVMQEQDHLGEIPAEIFPSKYSIAPVILHTDTLAPWKIINEDAVLIPKN